MGANMWDFFRELWWMWLLLAIYASFMEGWYQNKVRKQQEHIEYLERELEDR